MTMKTKHIVVETEDQDNATDTDNSLTNDSPHETEDENDSNVEYESSNEGGDSIVNVGWADSVAKILKTNKPKGKKTLVLSKAKIITNTQKRKLKETVFEVEAEDGQIKKECIEESDDEQTHRKKKKDLPTYRVKPNILDKDRERLLSKIATKGVVQLFNAVKNQQKDIDSKLKEAGSLEVKRDKVLKNIDKREFLNVLMGTQTTSTTSDVKFENKTKQHKTESTPTWSVLRDDFLMSAKMKDWDKKLEDNDDMKEEDIDAT